MRKKRNWQMSIFDVAGRHPIGNELEQISRILDANPEIIFGGDIDMGQYAGSVILIPADSGQSRYG